MTDTPDPYTDDDLDRLVGTLLPVLHQQSPGTLADVDNPYGPTLRTVASVDWSGDYNPTAYRPVNWPPIINWLPTRTALDRYAAARRAAGDAKPYRSYTATGATAQWQHIAGTRAGRGALAAVGMSPSRQTVRRWAQTGVPARSPYRQQIHQAYRWMAEAPVRAAQSEQAAARQQLVRAIDAAFVQKYGQVVRLHGLGGAGWT